MNIQVTPSDYFSHPHNNTIINERAIEVVLGLRYIEAVVKSTSPTNLVEIGAVMPYYIGQERVFHECVDPIDPKATVVAMAETYDYKGKNVLTISTVEHIGHGDYRLDKNTTLAYDVVDRIYTESQSCLISWPIGYHKHLDNAVQENADKFEFFFYVKRNSLPLVWEYVVTNDGFSFEYGKPFNHANSVIFLIKHPQ